MARELPPRRSNPVTPRQEADHPVAPASLGILEIIAKKEAG